jgi:cell division protein FtsB
MQAENLFNEKKEEDEGPNPLHHRALDWVQHGWRSAGTVVAVILALAFGWSVINGRHGLSFWYQQRAEEKRLHTEIQDLQQENSHLHEHIERLKSDPGAIEHEAREKLHYAKPGEVIYTLPPQPQTHSQPAGGGR